MILTEMRKIIKNHITRCFINDTHVSIALRKLGNLFLHHSSPSRVYIYHHFNNDLLKRYLIPSGWLEGGGDKGIIYLLMAHIEEQFCDTMWGKKGTKKKHCEEDPCLAHRTVFKDEPEQCNYRMQIT